MAVAGVPRTLLGPNATLNDRLADLPNEIKNVVWELMMVNDTDGELENRFRGTKSSFRQT